MNIFKQIQTLKFKMKKIILMALTIFVMLSNTAAQFTTVNYDYERNWFNEGQPLPSETSMVIKGAIPENTQLVEVMILNGKGKDVLYTTIWQKTENQNFSQIIPFKLRADNDYDVAFNFYQNLSDKKKEKLEADINSMINAYVNASLKDKKAIKFVKSNKKMVKEMNEILTTMTSQYKTGQPNWQPAFSDLIEMKLDHLEKTNVKKQSKGESKDVVIKTPSLTQIRTTMVDDLRLQIKKEIGQMLQGEVNVLSTTRYIDDYPTAKKANSIALNAGYGGVYLSGEWDDFTTGASPYVGLAFPLGNSILGSKFMSNTSVTMGVFLNNFEDENGNEVKGLIVNRPLYLGLDHKLFQFIRVNAGATFLEGMNISEDINIEPTKKVMIRPYLGLSARIDLSIGLGK